MSLLRLYLTGLVLLLLWIPMFAQDTTDILNDTTGIEISAFVRPDPVAQNRKATLTVHLKWYGDLDRYDIHPLDTPIVENFEIKGSGSANRIIIQDGRKIALREYRFTLNPQAMGMAYVEGMILTYTDRATDTDFRLVTQRIPVKVADPVKESSGLPRFIWLMLGSGLVGLGVLLWFVHRNRQASRLSVVEDAKPELEQVFKQELQSAVDLNDANLNENEVYVYLSRLLRRFLSQKFELAGMEATTPELVASMKRMGFTDSFVESVRILLDRADAVKFSGRRVERQELDQCYLRIESILEKCSQNETQSFFEKNNN